MRHAQSAAQLQREIVIGRTHDAPLTKTGLEQAEQWAKQWAEVPVATLYSSTCRRALQTAKPIAKVHKLSLQNAPLLVERSHGDLEGMAKSDAYTPELVEKIHADQWRWVPPGGESLEATGARVTQFLQCLEDPGEGRIVLAVTHQMLLWSVFHLCTRCHHAVLPRLPLRNGGIVEVETGGDPPLRLIRWNATIDALLETP